MARTVFAFATALLCLATAAHAQDEPRRPRLLVPLYSTYAGLTAGDMITTFQAYGRGAREANPVRQALGPRSVKGLVVQGVSVAAALYAVDELRKRGHPRMALAEMIVLNAVSGAIVLNNAHVSRR